MLLLTKLIMHDQENNVKYVKLINKHKTYIPILLIKTKGISFYF